MQLALMVSQDCITSFTQGFFYVPRNDVMSRAAEIPLQIANPFPLHFMITLLLQWTNAARSGPGLGLDFHAEVVLPTSPQTISHSQ